MLLTTLILMTAVLHAKFIIGLHVHVSKSWQLFEVLLLCRTCRTLIKFTSSAVLGDRITP